MFSDEIELSFDIEGLGVRNYRANKVKYATSIKPPVIKIVNGTGIKQKGDRRPDIGYYANSEGSFACKPSVVDGQHHCDLVALIHDDKESCFIKGDSAFCQTNTNKRKPFDNIPANRDRSHKGNDSPEAITKPYNGNRTDRPIASQRQRRQISPVTSGARVVQIAFYLDQAFMEKFYRLNPSNDAAAEEDAMMYTIMLTNEMSIRLQDLKSRRLSYRGGILELAATPSVIIYPAKGEDFSFIDKNGEFLLIISRENFLNYSIANPPAVPFQHSMLITGLDIYQEDMSILGQVPVLSTVCSSTQSFLSISINEARDDDVMFIMTHELGHSLGADHDENMFGACTPKRWIMTANSFEPDKSTKDSINRFSRCSAIEIRDHLASQTDCLARPSDDDFLENFCVGPRGFRSSSLDNQCQMFYDFGPNYTECAGVDKVEPDQCWMANSVYCYPGTGDLCYVLPYIADGTPCNGRRRNKSYYCYRGECVEENELCPDGTPPLPTLCPCDLALTNIGRLFCCLQNDCCEPYFR